MTYKTIIHLLRLSKNTHQIETNTSLPNIHSCSIIHLTKRKTRDNNQNITTTKTTNRLTHLNFTPLLVRPLSILSPSFLFLIFSCIIRSHSLSDTFSSNTLRTLFFLADFAGVSTASVTAVAGTGTSAAIRAGTSSAADSIGLLKRTVLFAEDVFCLGVVGEGVYACSPTLFLRLLFGVRAADSPSRLRFPSAFALGATSVD
jgi:hypothetical protein